MTGFPDFSKVKRALSLFSFFASFLWEIKNENHWAIMEVWSVRLGLGFGEKKVLIHPIKVYWAPLMEDWRIFIPSNRDIFSTKKVFFKNKSKPKSKHWTLRHRRLCKWGPGLIKYWCRFVGLQCQCVKVQFQMKRKYWQRFSLTKLNEMKWFAIIDLESKVSFSFIQQCQYHLNLVLWGDRQIEGLTLGNCGLITQSPRNWKIGTKNGKCFVALNKWLSSV